MDRTTGYQDKPASAIEWAIISRRERRVSRSKVARISRAKRSAACACCAAHAEWFAYEPLKTRMECCYTVQSLQRGATIHRFVSRACNLVKRVEIGDWRFRTQALIWEAVAQIVHIRHLSHSPQYFRRDFRLDVPKPIIALIP